MRLFLSFFISVFFYLGVFSQNIHVLGKVLNANTNQVLPYAHVMFQNYGMGTSSNKDGIFAFHIPDTLRNENLIISYVGFNKKTIKITELLKDKTVKLIPRTEGLSEVSIEQIKEQEKFIYRPNRGDEPIGISNMNAGLYPSTIARHYKKPEKFLGKNCYLDFIQIYFYPVEEQKDLSPKFRLHIYEVDESGLPGQDLLDDRVLEKTSYSSSMKVELLDEKIKIPGNGFFIGLEHLFIKENQYTETKDFYLNDSLVAKDFQYQRYAPVYKGVITEPNSDLKVYFYNSDGWKNVSDWEIMGRDSVKNFVAPVFKIKITD